VYTSEAEESMRKAIFLSNIAKIEEHNKKYVIGEESFSLGVNKFTDLLQSEFQSLNGYRPSDIIQAESIFVADEGVELPDSIDWRKEGIVTRVKDQEQCGSCWAFSATGSLEGQHAKKTGQLITLSEQQLVDCSQKFGNNGCNGGLMDYAFKYIKAVGGVELECAYTYTGKDGKCEFEERKVAATLDGFVDIKSEDEDALKQALATVGPISVAIDASHNSFQLYNSGVYHEPACSQTSLDHGVLAVGYGTENGKDYWLVKNSWGDNWGEDGYIKMSRNRNNNCGIATQASYPTV